MAVNSSHPNLRSRKHSEEQKRDASTMEEIEITPLIKNPVVKKDDPSDGFLLIPLRERSMVMRLDVWPFLVCYMLLISLDYLYFDEETEENMPTVLRYFSQISFPLVLLGHIVLFLLQQWDVFWRSSVGYQQMNKSSLQSQWTHCLVEAPHVDKHQSAHEAGIVPIKLTTDGVSVVNFQDVIFRFCPKTPNADTTLWMTEEDEKISKVRSPTVKADDSPLFQRLRYPIYLPLSFYTNWEGHSTMSKVLMAQNAYGHNTTPIELPPFLELLQEQVVAPFFLFQVFCVILWSLDEYWYYALFTFFALLMFESTVAYNRLHSLQRLRSHTIGTRQRPLYVYRPAYPPGRSGWVQISAAEIAPGDIVSCRQVSIRTGRRHASQKQEEQLNRVPADILLLKGDVVVDESLLTGESVPQLKVALEESAGGILDLQEHKAFILWGGTTMLVTNPGSSPTKGMPLPPDGGVVGVVLRTGFETAQGSLLRTMAHTQKSVDGIHTSDTYVFILLLLLCAIASASMVWHEGSNDPTRNKFRLVLHVIIIVTSVVPPELPMELSLAVTNSVADLMKRCQVYCTEVFRIPLAGQVNICCFDKTGTLTSDEMQLAGVRSVDEEGKFMDVVEPGGKYDWHTERIMVACHSLALTSMATGSGNDELSNVIGDPLEKTVLKETGYRLIQNNALRAMEPSEGRPNNVLVLQRFGFTSKLKRMTVLVREESSTKTWVLTKGAPETIKQFLRPDTVPRDYDRVSMQHMSSGQRVLAMACRTLTKKEATGNVREMKREAAECDLIFVGFLLMHCPIKPDSASIVSELISSGHEVVMITGDAVLTAAEVARKVGIIRKRDGKFPPAYHLEKNQLHLEHSGIDPLAGYRFVPLLKDEKIDSDLPAEIPLSMSAIPGIRHMVEEGRVSLCLSGSALQQLVLSLVGIEDKESIKDEKQILFHPSAQEALKELAPLLSVFARHAPRQKEAIIAAYNLSGLNTMMCGDGTNDVGALRRAHVGVSIISAPEIEAKHRSAAKAMKRAKSERKKGKSSSKKSASSFEESMRQLREAQEELDGVELGDASIASPFTSRTVSIRCCKDILQQGRCTLVTMLQIYKILGINCLVNAMVLSKLYMHGVKQGDRQLTVLGIGVAALFLFVTRGKPLPELSATRPPASVMCAQALLSIAIQFAIHFSAILIATEVALAFNDPYDPSIIPDGPFNPNTLNTCTFLMSCLATINTFAINYRGEPFVEPLAKNTMLLRSLQVCYAILLICALEVFPPLNDLMQLAEFPVVINTTEDVDWMTNKVDPGSILSMLTNLVKEIGFPMFMCGLMVIDTGLTYFAERLILKFF